MLTQIISNCGCCGLPCCKSTSAPLWQYTWTAPYGSDCYNSNAPRTYNLRDVGFPYKNQDNDIVNLKDFSCFAEEGFEYKWNLKGIGSGQVNTDISGEIDEEGVLVGLPTTISVYCRYGAVGTLTCSRKKIGQLDTVVVYKNFTKGSDGCPQSYTIPYIPSFSYQKLEFCHIYQIIIESYYWVSRKESIILDFYFGWFLSKPQDLDSFDVRVGFLSNQGNTSFIGVYFIEKKGYCLNYYTNNPPFNFPEINYYPGVSTNDTHSTCPTTSPKKFTITLTPDEQAFYWSYSIQWHVPYE